MSDKTMTSETFYDVLAAMRAASQQCVGFADRIDAMFSASPSPPAPVAQGEDDYMKLCWDGKPCQKTYPPQQSEQPEDNPELDGTDAAHPAWWRGVYAITTPPAAGQVDWRELARRLYIELFHCDQQMTSGRRKWKQGSTVRDALADAKAALAATKENTNGRS